MTKEQITGVAVLDSSYSLNIRKNEELLRLEPSGDIYLKGRLLVNDIEIVEGFRAFLNLPKQYSSRMNLKDAVSRYKYIKRASWSGAFVLGSDGAEYRLDELKKELTRMDRMGFITMEDALADDWMPAALWRTTAGLQSCPITINLMLW